MSCCVKVTSRIPNDHLARAVHRNIRDLGSNDVELSEYLGNQAADMPAWQQHVRMTLS
jgi:hypothetical protein